MLQMGVKACNDVVGPEGLCPTLRVFGSIPRPARKAPAADKLHRERILDQAMDAVLKEQAERRISFGLKHSYGSKGVETSEELRTLPSGALVYVYRQKSKPWEGPFTFIEISGETVVIQTNAGRKIFRSTVVKPARNSELKDNSDINPEAFYSTEAHDIFLGHQMSKSQVRKIHGSSKTLDY